MKSVYLVVIVALVNRTLASAFDETTYVRTDQIGKTHRVLGRLHLPLGDVATVEGVVVVKAPKGHEKRWNLRVYRINGVFTQENVEIPIRAYSIGWDADSPATPIPRMPESGRTYEMEGFSTGEFEGTPLRAWKNAGLVRQDMSFEFCETFVVYRAVRLAPIRFSPIQFEGRKSLIAGLARNDNGSAVIAWDSWSVVVLDGTPWPKDVLGKMVETYGFYSTRATPKQFKLRDGTWHLVKLQDQLGKKVALRGRARTANGHDWWFEYRDVDLYVEELPKLPGWSGQHDSATVEVRGTLEMATLPVINCIDCPSTGEKRKEYFIVRNASWVPLDHPLLATEMPHD